MIFLMKAIFLCEYANVEIVISIFDKKILYGIFLERDFNSDYMIIVEPMDEHIHWLD